MKEIVEKSIKDLWNQTRMLYLGITLSINNTYKTNYTSKDIMEVVKKNGLKFKTVTPLTEEEKNEVVNKYVNEKMKVEFIGIPYGVGKNYIIRVLNERGVMRNIGQSNIKYTDNAEIEKQVIEMYNNKTTILEIKKILNLNYNKIIYYLNKNKISIRSNKKYVVDEFYFEKIDTQNKAYIFGLFMADGCNFRKNPKNICVKIELQENDKDILIKIMKELKFDGVLYFKDLNSKNRYHQNTWTLCIYNKKISDDLYKLGMMENKSLIKSFPDNIPSNLIPHFIRGYFDGNGSVSLRSNTNLPTTSITSNERMIDGISKIYTNLNIKYNKIPKVKVFDIIVYGHEYNRKLREYLYKDANLYIERKHKKFYMFK